MDKIVVRGGVPLRGEITVSGSKNAALPLLFASLLTGDECRLGRMPQLADVRTALRLLRDLGVQYDWLSDTEVALKAEAVHHLEAPYDLVKTMRASFLVLGPLLARFGRARVSTPGGCAIGARPVNIHLDGLQRLGASIRVQQGYVEAEAKRLRGARITLEFPSVGATENLMMAATLAEGTTILDNAAHEPEIEDLALMLNNMGARIDGAGSSTVIIDGVSTLHGAEHTVIPDRVEAGTFLIAGAMTSGEVLVRGSRGDHLQAFLTKLREAGASVEETADGLRVHGAGRPTSISLITQPYPGFPTDLQAQMMALLTLSDGQSMLTETIFENRFLHAQELARLGADIRVHGNTAEVRGVAFLSGAPVMATDLRASVSLILAGLAAQGVTEIARVYHLDRGYERIEEKLSQLGADIRRVKSKA
ncbi:MAG TPA: UDP-N-acetylglucosamine 1-carboxyvinyltransferase [Candidatus Binatia bacterium]|jgi:UDP-N-acetylglucosamine 1-carboxyvinyltransferase|nr:UDP-N-acetylglucosamine 1-carboxyvinyltransferase [Candidatus Binatia bacterium]